MVIADFKKMKEKNATVSKLALAAAKASNVLEVDTEEKKVRRTVAFEGDMTLPKSLMMSGSEETKLYNFVQLTIQKLEASLPALLDGDEEDNYQKLVVWVNGFRDTLVTVGTACSGQTKGAMANAVISVWDLKNNQSGENLRVCGVAAVYEILTDLLSGPLGSAKPDVCERSRSRDLGLLPRMRTGPRNHPSSNRMQLHPVLSLQGNRGGRRDKSVQLNGHILDSSSTGELCELIEAHAEEFDSINVETAF